MQAPGARRERLSRACNLPSCVGSEQALQLVLDVRQEQVLPGRLFAIADCCSTSATALLGATRWPARKACPSCVGSPVTGLHTLMQLCGQPNLAPLLRSGHGRLHAPSARRLRDGHVLKELVCVCSFIARERTCAAGSRACELNDDDVLRACNTMAWPLVSRAGGPVRCMSRASAVGWGRRAGCPLCGGRRAGAGVPRRRAGTWRARSLVDTGLPEACRPQVRALGMPRTRVPGCGMSWYAADVLGLP